MEKVVPDFPNYSVTPDGKVFSTFFGRRRELKPVKKTTGYYSVTLVKDKKHYPQLLHRLILKTFKEPTAPHVNHIDGNKANNSLENLEWVSMSENARHARKLGLKTDPKGEAHHHTRFLDSEIQLVRDLRGSMDAKNVASLFGMHPTYVRQLWRHAWKRTI